MIRLEFLPPAGGQPQRIQVSGDKPKPFVIQRVEPSDAPSRDDLRAFSGEYLSSELDVTYNVLARDSGLAIRIPGRADVVVQPVFKDAFAGEVLGVVKFSRDARDVVTSFTVNTSGVRRLRFDRVTP